MARIWARPITPPRIDWELIGETSRAPSAAVAKALWERSGIVGHSTGPVGEVLFEDPEGTTKAAFTISLNTAAAAMTELPESPGMEDLDAPVEEPSAG